MKYCGGVPDKVCLSQELSFCLTKHPPLFRLMLVVAKVFSALKLAFGLCQSASIVQLRCISLSLEDHGMTMLTRFRRFCIWCWALLKEKWTISLLQPKFLWVQSQLFTTENHASLDFTWKPGTRKRDDEDDDEIKSHPGIWVNAFKQTRHGKRPRYCITRLLCSLILFRCFLHNTSKGLISAAQHTHIPAEFLQHSHSLMKHCTLAHGHWDCSLLCRSIWLWF